MAILRDYCDSELVNMLTPSAENLFTRLLCKCDDFGNIIADPVLIKAMCFPRKNYRLANIENWIKELSMKRKIGTSKNPTSLVRIYDVSGKQYIHIPNFGCEKRYKKRIYPPPLEDDIEVEAEVEIENNAPERKNFYLRGRPVNQNAGEWLRERFLPRLESDFMTKFRALDMDRMLVEFSDEAYLMEYREDGHVFNSFKKYCEKKLEGKDNGKNFSNNRKGHNIEGITGAARRLLQQTSGEVGSGSDTGEHSPIVVD